MPDITPRGNLPVGHFPPPTCPKCDAVRTRRIATNGVEEWLIHNPGCVVLAPETQKEPTP